MLNYCQDCNEETEQKFIGVNPDNELHLYQCICCDNQLEVSEEHAEFNREFELNNR